MHLTAHRERREAEEPLAAQMLSQNTKLEEERKVLRMEQGELLHDHDTFRTDKADLSKRYVSLAGSSLRAYMRMYVLEESVELS